MKQPVWRPAQPMRVGDYQLTPSEAWFRVFQDTWRALDGGADELQLLERCVELYATHADCDPSVLARQLFARAD